MKEKRIGVIMRGVHGKSAAVTAGAVRPVTPMSCMDTWVLS